MLNLPGPEVACIRKVNDNIVRRKEEVTVYYWVFVFFIASYDSCHTFIIPFTTLLRKFHIRAVIIRVGFGGHSLHLIS